ncbi:MAG: SDR family NAD(P)-dependent oxidoreductase [Gemmatimonadales bacterium]
MGLEGLGAVVTGGGRGIGSAIARALADAKVRVVVAARTSSEITAVAEAIAADGGSAYALECDVTDETSVARLAMLAHDRLGAIDILVNNAGIALSALVHKTSLQDWNRQFAVNATGTFLCTRAFVPHMVERGWGRIINIASVAGVTGDQYVSAYSASKHAVLGLTRSVAAEVVRHGITVNAICPGYVDTAMTDASIARIKAKTGRSNADALEAILATTPQHRLIHPTEVAHMVLSLCHEEAGSINGEAIVIDGGHLRA